MIIKSLGIVLSQTKFADNKRIVNIFTEKSGKKAFLIFNNSKKKYSSNIFQPLFILNLEFIQREKQKVLNLSEASIYKPFTSVFLSVQKKAVVFFLTEILNKIIEDDFQDEKLFLFISESLILLDNLETTSNFHLSFMTKLMNNLGISPLNNWSDEYKFFDLVDSCFSDYYRKDRCLDEVLSKKFSDFLNFDIQTCEKIQMNVFDRRNLLVKILDYFSLHYKNFGNLNSPDVLAELFN